MNKLRKVNFEWQHSFLWVFVTLGIVGNSSTMFHPPIFTLGGATHVPFFTPPHPMRHHHHLVPFIATTSRMVLFKIQTWLTIFYLSMLNPAT